MSVSTTSASRNLDLSSVNHDALSAFSSFLDAKTAVSLASAHHAFRSASDDLILTIYEATFGTLDRRTFRSLPNDELEFNSRHHQPTFTRLLSCAGKEPNEDVPSIRYQAPKSFLERWKWVVGIENELDDEVQQNDRKQVYALEQTKPCSILQLKNQMARFWYLDQRMESYEQFKAKERAQAVRGLVQKLFFACLGFIFKSFYKPVEAPSIRKTLKERSSTTYATIGSFKVDNKTYDVLALHSLEKKPKEGENRDCFHSSNNGKTSIAIFEHQASHNLTRWWESARGSRGSFVAQIGRQTVNDPLGLHTEDRAGHGKTLVSKQSHHVVIDFLRYSDITNNLLGSDRVFDQRLTQIMIEMTLQNRAESASMSSIRSNLPVLTAGGFKNHLSAEVMEELREFRAVRNACLFPPARDYGAVRVTFKPSDVQESSVHYSRAGPESWSAIIADRPILTPGASILPEYWATKPNLATEESQPAATEENQPS